MGRRHRAAALGIDQLEVGRDVRPRIRRRDEFERRGAGLQGDDAGVVTLSTMSSVDMPSGSRHCVGGSGEWVAPVDGSA
jgi:hypothetical protein